MTLWQFRSNLKRLSSRLIIVDSEGHEVFNNNLGIYVHWIKKDIYDGRTIDYIPPRCGYGKGSRYREPGLYHDLHGSLPVSGRPHMQDLS